MTSPLAPCKCGAMPRFRAGQVGLTYTLQLYCEASGQAVGAFLTYTKPEDKARMVQAGIDGWNLAHISGQNQISTEAK
jgi:hypothetical protein